MAEPSLTPLYSVLLLSASIFMDFMLPDLWCLFSAVLSYPLNIILPRNFCNDCVIVATKYWLNTREMADNIYMKSAWNKEGDSGENITIALWLYTKYFHIRIASCPLSYSNKRNCTLKAVYNSFWNSTSFQSVLCWLCLLNQGRVVNKDKSQQPFAEYTTVQNIHVSVL